jgi:hypothetical protein
VPLSTRSLGSAAASLSDVRLNFGFVPVGADGVKDIVIENRGSGGVLSTGAVTATDGTPAVFVEGSAGAFGEHFVNPGDALRIPVMFRPNGPGVFEGAFEARPMRRAWGWRNHRLAVQVLWDNQSFGPQPVLTRQHADGVGRHQQFVVDRRKT